MNGDTNDKDASKLDPESKFKKALKEDVEGVISMSADTNAKDTAASSSAAELSPE